MAATSFATGETTHDQPTRHLATGLPIAMYVASHVVMQAVTKFEHVSHQFFMVKIGLKAGQFSVFRSTLRVSVVAKKLMIHEQYRRVARTVWRGFDLGSGGVPRRGSKILDIFTENRPFRDLRVHDIGKSSQVECLCKTE